MASDSHLEKMGRELKCPICLSLLNSAVSLTCNHVFCNSCLEKSMRSALLCPVCKMPFRRKEMRPAPYMNNLVSVYKSMETASGVKILVSQDVASAPIPGIGDVKLTLNDNVDAGNNLKTSTETWVSEKRKREECGDESFDHQGSSWQSRKPSYPIKKRVQVPERVCSENGMLPENMDGGEATGINEDKLQQSKHVFTPFFSLGDDNDPEKSNAKTDESTPIYTPPPNFSDINDLDDEVPCKINLMDDSEMFDWTQRPCSPELCSSPVALQIDDLAEKNSTFQKSKSTSVETETNLQMYSRKRDKKNAAMEVKLHSEADKVNNQHTKETAIENASELGRSSGTAKKACLDPLSQDGNVLTVFGCTEAVGNRKESEFQRILDAKNMQSGSQRNGMMKGRKRGVLKTLEVSEKIEENQGGENQPKVEVPSVDKATLSPKGPVLMKCRTSARTICCAFCQSSEETEASGAMMCYDKGKLVGHKTEAANAIHLHKSCAEWAPNVYFEGDKVVNLEAELSRSRRIKCACCGLKGAALGCYAKCCRKSFHVPCAKRTPDCRWDYENFVMLCPIHASSQLPYDGQQSQINHRRQQSTKRKSNVPKSECSTYQWNCNKFKGLVLCFSGLTNEEKAIVNEFERLSGARILKKWTSSVTHVIASRDENGASKRTLKFLMGILEGKWVLGIEWIRACIDACDLVDEHPYEVSLDIHGIRDGPKLGRSRLLNKQPRLFQGYKFFVVSEFASSYKGFLHELVTGAGGKVLSRDPVKGDDASSTYIVYSIETLDKHAQAKALARSTGAHLVSNQWILNSVAGYWLQDIVE